MSGQERPQENNAFQQTPLLQKNGMFTWHQISTTRLRRPLKTSKTANKTYTYAAELS